VWQRICTGKREGFPALGHPSGTPAGAERIVDAADEGFERFHSVLHGNDCRRTPLHGVFDTAKVNFSIVPVEGFDSFRGPGVRNLDLSVARSFRLNERLGLKFGIEAFDLLNHANFQQGAVDNGQYTTTERCAPQPDGPCTALADLGRCGKQHFRKPIFSSPKYGSREFAALGALQFLQRKDG